MKRVFLDTNILIDYIQAAQSGYRSYRTFSVAFKQRTGQSVKDWIAEQEKSAFYAKQVDEEMDKLWESGQFDQKKLDELRGQHLRTPYK